MMLDMNDATNTAAAITLTAKGRHAVTFSDPITGKAKRRSFRTRREAEIFVAHVAKLDRFWANSASASVMDDYASGNVVTIHAG